MATSKLQIAVGDMLDKTFPQYRIRENYRPDWLLSSNLTKLELDFYIEDIKVAFEIQGVQHYIFVEFFHQTREAFEQRKSYDEQKKYLCYGAGVKLYEIFTLLDAIVVIKNLQEKQGLIETYYQQPIQNQLPKTPKLSKEKLTGDAKVLYKYEKQYKNIDKYSNIQATIEQKTKEIKQFRKKCSGFYKKNGRFGRTIPFFGFKFLNTKEQEALFEEFDILSKIPSFRR